MTEREALSAGQTLGRYELLAQVARGGMGEVWAARLQGARGFQKLVAIKTLLPELRDDPRIEQMLLEEARIASAIQHPNVVQTTELGEHRGYLYLVMEWIDGEALSFVQKRAEERGDIPIEVAVHLVAQACRGLHAAHELTSDLGVPLGVVHRDVSPHNLLVTHTGVIKVVDFGIAKAMNQDTSLTDNGEVKGKYAYMAPEQVLGDDVDRRADVFSLGITLYLLTTGHHPFKTGDKASVIRAITNDAPPPPPSTYILGYPSELAAVVMKALEKAPDQRFATTEAFRAALHGALPEAFVPGFDATVREFLSRTMGDRATARREALRRFQLAADERRLVDGGSGALPVPPAQSGGSFRAIIIDQSAAVIPGALATERRLSQAPTALGLAQRPRSRAPLAFAALGLCLAALAFWFGRPTSFRHSPAASPAPATTLAAPAPSPEPPAPPAELPSAPASSASPDPVAPSATAPSATAAPPPARPELSPTRPKARSKTRPHTDAARDLLAPEYAK
jgi:serine/threonine-protein kinase